MKKNKNNEIKKSIFSPFKALKFLAEKPVTIQTPFEHHEVPENYRGFHVNDLDTCIGCGSCAKICDNAAIRMVKIPDLPEEEGKSDMRPVIDYGRCCWCALCVDICPSASLSMTKEYTHVSDDLDTFLIYPNKLGMHGTEEEIAYKMDDTAVNFLVPERVEMEHVEPEKRVDSFIEMVLGYPKEEAIAEASRCLGCGLCTDNCPTHMHIPEYIAAIWNDDSEESLRQIYKTNPIPAICGRICTHKCEDACALTIRGEAVAIRWLKRYTVDTVKDFKKALEQDPKPESGKKVAIIGAGPAGLSAAYFLRLMGHGVTVFDQFSAAGGAVRFGPPAYRLPFDAVDADANYIESLGAEFRFNTTIGKDISFEELQEKYDAVFIGVGYTESRSTRIPNSDKCLPALKFLRETKLMGEDQSKNEMGKEVIVIGGGNVAMDVAREAARVQKIKFPNEKTLIKVFCLEDAEHMPADPDEIREGTEEGIQFNPAWGPMEVVLDDNGNIAGLKIKKVLSIFDSEGRFNPQYDDSTERVEPADMIFEAIGQGPNFSFIPEKTMEKIEFTPRRKVKVDENGMTTVKGVFAGGDIANSRMDAISAVADAKMAAQGIDKFFKK